MDDSHPLRSLSIGHPIPEIKLFQTDLQTPRSRSWVWLKGKVIQSAQCHINSIPFHFTSIRPTIPEIELFRNSTLKHPSSRSWVRSKVEVTYCTQYPTNALPFRFTSISTNHSWDMAKIVFDLEKTHPKFLKKIRQNNCFLHNFSNHYKYDFANCVVIMFCISPRVYHCASY